MQKNVMLFVTLGFWFAYPTIANAQLGNMLNQLKSAAEKIQKETQQQNTSTQNQNNRESQPTPSLPSSENKNNTTNQSAIGLGEKNPIRVVTQQASQDVPKIFREIWCKVSNDTVNGPIDFKGIKTGDLCHATDDLIIAIESKLKSSKLHEWMTIPNSQKEGSVVIANKLVANDKAFFSMAILIDPYTQKSYIASFSGLICAADPSNSLNADNPFRTALQSKYGSPASIHTQYDNLKAQIEDLERLNSNQKKQAITVSEAKNARDTGNLLPTLKASLNSADKNTVLALVWDYEKGNSERPIGAASISQAGVSEIRDVGGCSVKFVDKERYGQPKLDYGFVLRVAGTKQLSQLEASIDAKNKAQEKEKVQKAPAPKF
jgi:hypothetical protein